MASKAEKLLKKMRRSQTGWHSHDLHSLYLGFGFKIRAGSNHDIISHPVYLELRQVVSRHPSELSPGYIRDAIKIIDRLRELEE